MNEVLKEYDTAQALRIAGITNPTPRDLALLDRFFQIYEGNVYKSAQALRKYLATGSHQ